MDFLTIASGTIWFFVLLGFIAAHFADRRNIREKARHDAALEAYKRHLLQDFLYKVAAK